MTTGIPAAGGVGPAHAEGARIVIVRPGFAPRPMTDGFHSAADPDLSFDGERMLFAGKRKSSDDWNIFEMRLDGSEVRQITRGLGDCRNPLYQGTLYTIVSDKPWHQITFVSNAAAELNEEGDTLSTSLYSCRTDGSEVRRLTFNPSSDLDPTLLPDGRLLFASWQRSTLDRGLFGRVSLFASHTDGIDYALFAGDEGRRVKRMPCVTTDGLVVFVEGHAPSRDGAGVLASVSLRRNLHSHRQITRERDGLFHSPSPLPGGKILVSRRRADDNADHGVYRMDPDSGRLEPVFDDPDYHDIQARLVASRPQPDGRSSVVDAERPNGKLYCLNVLDSSLFKPEAVSRGSSLRLRVLEGIPRLRLEEDPRDSGHSGTGIPPILQRRFLGEIQVEKDGSFNIEVPANIPIQLQLLDEKGMALASCGWIWVRNRETRGCIGCHEDPERTPENRFVEALRKPSVDLTLPPKSRRTVDFRRDVMPILAKRCSTGACHGDGTSVPILDDRPGSFRNPDGAVPFNRAYESLLSGVRPPASSPAPTGKFVHPGRARTSPLIQKLLRGIPSHGSQASTQGAASIRMMPPDSKPLTEDEVRTIVEWIDLGALYDGIPRDAESRPGRRRE